MKFNKKNRLVPTKFFDKINHSNEFKRGKHHEHGQP